jgi:ferritin-like metal-binding protein YciE
MTKKEIAQIFANTFEDYYTDCMLREIHMKFTENEEDRQLLEKRNKEVHLQIHTLNDVMHRFGFKTDQVNKVRQEAIDKAIIKVREIEQNIKDSYKISAQ